MRHIFQTLRHEVLGILPAVLYFLAAFNLMHWIESLYVAGSSVTVASATQVSLAALIVAKVLLMVDLLPVVKAFNHRPLLYSTLWKTLLYSLGALLFRVLEALLPLLLADAEAGWRQYLTATRWPQFWASQALVMLFLGIFVAFREMAQVVGTDRARRLFLGH